MPQQSPTTGRRSLVAILDNSYLLKFLLVGGLSFAIDLALLVVLHEVFGVGLWLATPVAFLTSLIFNFLLQRIFTFKATNRSHASFIRYAILVAFNTLATDLIVNTFANLELTYTAGKVVATALTMVWNFYLYKYWIFRSDRQPTQAGTENDPDAVPQQGGVEAPITPGK
ncbi:GtrA family protein [Arthrobacter glacialis]|uniref:GtrA/DPMS transmembrane domain-containing protein n=1 Tax=Arthrobacter glacialis TaxID=1664 RepID=A0A2S3ZZH7_ARTGL|nr:GtrA family protein [Arthrobacter glacialis]POH58451.1 hypothetical protein CVS28_11730 [Arthrobacter glacialis]POH74613.1 hypothetical protein CVS27_05190 [Arthrobacter glacialis]